MRSLIVCASRPHGNTRRVADRIAEVLDAEVLTPEAVDLATLRDYDLIGHAFTFFRATAFAERLRKRVGNSRTTS